MREMYRAQNTKLNWEVALKTVLAELASNQNGIRWFVRKASQRQ